MARFNYNKKRNTSPTYNYTPPPPPPVSTLEKPIEELREEFQWGSFGRNGTENLNVKILKDISDSHLVHIIGHLIEQKNSDTLIVMLEEARYRCVNNIYVEDYNEHINKDDSMDNFNDKFPF
jgi:hypothetical protein